MRRHSLKAFLQWFLREKMKCWHEKHASSTTTSFLTGTIVSGSGILTPLKKTLERKICWWWGIRSPVMGNKGWKSYFYIEPFQNLNHFNGANVGPSFWNAPCWWTVGGLILSRWGCVRLPVSFKFSSLDVDTWVYLGFSGWGKADQHQTSRARADSRLAVLQKRSPGPTHPPEGRIEYLQPAAQELGTSESLRSRCNHPQALLRTMEINDMQTLSKQWITPTAERKGLQELVKDYMLM